MNRVKKFIGNYGKRFLFLIPILILLIGASYAYFSVTLNSSKVHSIISAKLSLSLSENASDGINIQNAEPVTDAIGLKYIPYTFTVTNDGNINSDYKVYLDDLELAEGEIRLTDNYVKYNLVKDGKTIATRLLSETGINPNRVLDSGIIKPGESYTYELKLWVDVNAPNDAQNKVLLTQVRVEGLQQTNLAYQKIFNHTNIGENGGLDTSYANEVYVTGTNPNNYVWYSGKLWRVVSKNTTDNTIKLISQDNIATLDYVSTSEWLNDTFLNSLNNHQKFIKEGSTIELLSLDEYNKTSKNVSQSSGYLNNGLNWWVKDNIVINSDGSNSSSNSEAGVRPCITLSSDISIKSGTGTVTDPYILLGDNSAVNKDNLNTRNSGEYVKFNNSLYRIVNTSNDITKIVSIDSVGNRAFDTNGNNIFDATSSTNIGYYLNNDWYNSIANNYKNMIVTGEWQSGNSTVNANVGLISYKELMSGQFSSNSNSYWTITPTSSGNYYITNDGKLEDGVSTNVYGVKPAVYLNSNVYIIDGNGTLYDPYIITQTLDSSSITKYVASFVSIDPVISIENSSLSCKFIASEDDGCTVTLPTITAPKGYQSFWTTDIDATTGNNYGDVVKLTSNTTYYAKAIDTTRPVWTLNDITSTGDSNTVKADDKLTIKLDGTDTSGTVYSSLNENNIKVLLDGVEVIPTTKKLGEKKSITDGYRYELTIGGISGTGKLSIEIDGYTLSDKSGNTSEKTTITTDYTVDAKSEFAAIFTKDITVESIGSERLSCTVVDGDSCTIVLPSITASNGHTVDGWYDSEGVKVGMPGDSYDLKENVSLIAKATVNQYTVTYNYNANGGSSATKATDTVKYNEAVDLTPTAIKDGYEFVGWSLDPDTELVNEQLSMPGFNITLYAVFKKTITANFYYYDGEKQATAEDSCTIYNNTADSSCVFELPTVVSSSVGPNNSSYVGVTKEHSSNEVITSYNAQVSTSYYAYYEGVLTVNYSMGTGVTSIGSTKDSCNFNAMSNSSTYTSSTCTIKLPEIVADTGYTVDGWYDSTASKVGTSNSDYILSANKYLMAYATINKYNVTYDYKTNGGNEENATLELEYNQDVDLTKTATKDGYEFVGWNTNKNATLGLTELKVGTADITLYAIFEKTVVANFYYNKDNSVTNIQDSCTIYNNMAGSECKFELPTEITTSTGIDGATYEGMSKSPSIVDATETYDFSVSTNYYAYYKGTWSVDYSMGNGVSTIGKTKDSCTSYKVTDGNVYTSTSCDITLPTITAKSGYNVLGWYYGADNVGLENDKYTVLTNVSLEARAEDTEIPVCKFTTDSSVVVGSNLNVTLECTDTNQISEKELSSSDFTLSSNVLTFINVTAPTKITNGYRYQITLHGASTGEAIISLNEGVIKDIENNSNIKTDSQSIIVGGNPYKATFVKQGTGVTEIGYENSSCVTTGSSSTCTVKTPTITVKDGYTVVGWSTDKDATSGIAPEEDITLDSNQTYYAISYKNEITHTITFNKNGAVSQTDQDGNVSTEDTVTRSCKIERSYNDNVQATSCNIKTPIIEASINTPNIDGYGINKNGPATIEQNTDLIVDENTNTTYYAQTSNTEIKYTATYEKQGNGVTAIGATENSCTIPKTINGEKQEESCTVTAPTIQVSTGYTIVGWNTDKTATTGVASGEAISLTGDATYYSISYRNEITYTATFNKNGAGTQTNTEGTAVSDATVSRSCTIEKIYNDNALVNNCEVTSPVLTGSTNTPNVIGYNTDKDATTSTLDPDASLSLSGNVTYYAITTNILITRTASFYLNGAATQTNTSGTAVTDLYVTRSCEIKQTYNGNKQDTSCNITTPDITGSTNTPTVIGYNTDKDATTKLVDENTSISIGDNITYYAITMKDAVDRSITYALGSNVSSIGSTGNSCTINAVYNGVSQPDSCEITLPTINPNKGYTSVGWSETKDATSGIGEGTKLAITSSINGKTYYANASANAYTIEYYSEGVSKGTSSTKYGEEVTLETASNIGISKTGYTFKGWDSSEEASTVVYTDGATVSNLTESGTIKLYAVWKDETGPSCDFTSLSSISYGSTGTLTLSCTDTGSGMTSQTLNTSNFTTSSTSGSVIAVGEPTAITNGYEYTVTVNGAAAGVFNVSLNAGVLKDNDNNTNAVTSSSDITVNKIDITASKTNYSGTYDGDSHTFELSTTPSSNIEIYYSTSKALTSSNYSTDGTTEKPSVTNAGETTVYYYVHDTSGNYNDYASDANSNNASIQINKRAVTYTAGSSTKVYDGTALTNKTATLTAGTLVEGHTAEPVTTGTITNAGTTTNPLTALVIYDSNGTTVSSNYDITRLSGTLTVTKVTVEKPTAANYCQTLTYNGASQTLTKDASAGYTFNGNTGTNAGNYTITAALNDNSNYQWNDGTADDQTFECSIAKRPVTYTAGSSTKVYDGTALTNKTATLTDGTLVDGHIAEPVITGTITNAGTTTNPLTALVIKDSSGTTVSSNYDITRLSGTLTVTKADIAISKTDFNGEFDSYSHTFELSTTPSSDVEIYYSTSTALTSSNYSTSGTTTKPARIFAGETTIYYYVHDISGNYNDYASNANNNNAIISISRKPVEKPKASYYCKQDLTYTGAEQLLTNFTGTTSFTFSEYMGTNAGTYPVKVSLNKNYIWVDNTTDDVTIECNIAKATPTLTLSASSASVKVGDSTSFTVKTDVKANYSFTLDSTSYASVSPNSYTSIEANTEKTVNLTGISVGSTIVTITSIPTDSNYSVVSKTYTFESLAHTYTVTFNAISTNGGISLTSDTCTKSGSSYICSCTTTGSNTSCDITSPKINGGGPTPNVLGYSTGETKRENEWGSNTTKSVSNNATYYAHTYSNRATANVTFYANGATKLVVGTDEYTSSYHTSCQTPVTYNGEYAGTCSITTPIIVASDNTPIVLGYSTDSSATEAEIEANTPVDFDTRFAGHYYYAITKSEERNYSVKYEMGSNVASISKETDSCTIESTYNGVAQATSCTIQSLPTITPNAGYNAAGWYNGATYVGNENESLDISSSLTLTAKATPVVCRRATKLSTATCNSTDCLNRGYSSGDTITYGNLGTAHSTPQRGDAYDCDVNNDGTFDTTSERFYYLYQNSDQSHVLIAGFNTYNGAYSTTGTTVYNSNSYVAYGPTSAITHLPKPTQWTNSYLNLPTNSHIYTTSSVIYYAWGYWPLSTVSESAKAAKYSGYAARFLTFQEKSSICNNMRGNCEFLLQNTGYTGGINYWLQDVFKFDSNDNYATCLSSAQGAIIPCTISSKVGVRPVINVNYLEYTNDNTKTNSNIVAVYKYDQTNTDTLCVTGEESTCVQIANPDKYEAGTIVKYKVNSSTTKYFHVVHDDGDTLTMLGRENIADNVTWNTNTANNTSGPDNAISKVESATSGWTNVNYQSYKLGTTWFRTTNNTTCTYGSSLNCTSNSVYSGLARSNARARLLTVQELLEFNCTHALSGVTCPIWVYNYLSNSTGYGGTANGTNTTAGYWLSNGSTNSTVGAWNICIYGRICHSSIYDTNRGVRPVVVIDK